MTFDSMLAADIAAWPAVTAGCALVGAEGVLATAGAVDESTRWASVTKIIASLAVLDVVHDGLLDLDEPAGPPGSTVRHLLGHASGWAFDEQRVLAAPGTRRIYSNVGIDAVVELARARAGAVSVAAFLAGRVLEPLGMHDTVIVGPAAHGAVGPVSDLALLARELLAPRSLRTIVVDDAIAPSFPGLVGVLPGFGRQEPNDWGLGVELHGHKSPHWMPPSASASCAGHFGQSGAFVWADREVGLAAVAATGTDFGPWAAEAWPRDGERWLTAWRFSAAGGR